MRIDKPPALAQCSTPGCKATHELTLHSRCHPHAPTWTVYEQKYNTIRIDCSTCKQMIGRLELAPVPES